MEHRSALGTPAVHPDMPRDADLRQMVATRLRYRLHGDDRQPPIRLDIVRRSNRQQIPLGPRRHPDRFHHLRRHGDLARSDRDMVRGPVWPAPRRLLRRHHDRLGLGAERLRDSLAMLYLGAVVGGIGAGSVYGTCVGGEVVVPHRAVSRPAPRRRLRCGRGHHRRADRQDDRVERLRDGLPVFRDRPGLVVVLLSFLLRKPSTIGPMQKRSVRVPQTKVDRTPKQAVRTPVSGSCTPCSSWWPRGADGGGADRPDRPRFQGRGRPGQPVRPPDDRPDPGDLPGPCLRRLRPPVLRLGLRQYRP